MLAGALSLFHPRNSRVGGRNPSVEARNIICLFLKCYGERGTIARKPQGSQVLASHRRSHLQSASLLNKLCVKMMRQPPHSCKLSWLHMVCMSLWQQLYAAGTSWVGPTADQPTANWCGMQTSKNGWILLNNTCATTLTMLYGVMRQVFS